MSINGVHGEHDEPVPGPTTQRDECEGCEVCDLATELADERTQHQETIKRAETAEAERDLQRQETETEHARAEAAEAQAADRERERIFENSRLVQERQRALSAEAKLAAVTEHVGRLKAWCGDPDASATVVGSICLNLARALDGDGDG